VVNEMTHQRWSAPAPGNPQGLTLGEEGLDTFGFYTERYWIWVGERSSHDVAKHMKAPFDPSPSHS
jgi:hypothetical protein